MDVDFWASRVNSSSHHLSAMQTSRLNSENHLILIGSDGDEDVQACFPCPFCYVEIEVPLLCTHLQEEHCFDVKNSVCPVCAENLGKDMIGHFTGQHSHMLKRRRKSQRLGPWTNSSAMMLGKDFREISSFLGVNSTNGRGNTADSAPPDPLLSPFLCSVSLPDSKGTGDTRPSVDASATSDVKRKESSSTSDEAQEQEYQEKSKRAEFFQQLILSTIF